MTDGPYELPPGWRWVKLGEVGHILNGRTARKNEYLDENTGVKILKFRDLTTQGEIVWDNHKAGYVRADRRWSTAEVGDVLVTSAAHSPEQIGRKVAYFGQVPEDFGRVCFSAELLAIRPNVGTLDGRWLYWWLRSEGGFRELQKHVKEKHLVKSRAADVRIPLPPLSEQRRIVTRIEELMGRIREARRLREEAKRDADRLMPAALAEVFPRPGSSLPPAWRWVKLGDVCEIVMGQSPPSRTYNSERQGLPFFQGKADFGDLHPTARNWCSQPAKLAEPGDVLISVRAPVGPTNLADQRCCIGRGLAALRAGASLTGMFLLSYLRSIEKEFSLAGSGSTFKAITKRHLEGLSVCLPPLDEQHRIVAHLDGVQEQAKALRQAQDETDAELRRLEQSILAAAFRGEL